VPYTPPPRASYAEDPTVSRGRRHREPLSRTRTPWARDRDRVIHCTAFRRLKEKTQVFVAHEGDHYRTRLTHSLEVSQIARSIAGAMGLDSELAEGVALAHDLGHPPFGHAGEDELQRVMEPYGGFDHNVQTFRLLTALEQRYPAFDGLNLTWETLEGVVKHNGPVTDRVTRPSYKAVVEYSAVHDLALGTWPSAEAQVANLADDIAYNNHDVDDGLQAELFDLDDLSEVALVGPIIEGVRREFPRLDSRMQRLEVVRRMIGVMVDDVMTETHSRAAHHAVSTADEVRAIGRPLVAFSEPLLDDLAKLRAFLHTRMYRHYRMNRTRSAARRILKEMFELFMAEPEVLPDVWRLRTENRDEAGRARVVCDYVAGMTDRYAIEEHRKLFQLDIWT
jgi:dGTPase